MGRYCDPVTQMCAERGFTTCNGDDDCPAQQRCNTLTMVCIDGRRSCADGAMCPADQHCDRARGQCVACLGPEHCMTGWDCVNGGCVDPSVPVPDAGLTPAPDAGRPPAPDAGTPPCSSDPECSPPATICEAMMCTPGCAIPGGLPCGTGTVCNQGTGRCDTISGPCTMDAQCSPPTTVCEFGQCVNGCAGVGGLQCVSPMVCEPATGRCVDGGPVCLSDMDCSPPSSICDVTSGHCEDGCAITGCTAPLICDAAGGHCVASTVCTADAREDDDTSATAAALSAGLQPGLTSCAGDEDWFAIDLGVGDAVTVDVRFDHAEGNVDAELRDPGGVVVASSLSTTSDEQVGYTAVAAGAHSLRVWQVQEYGATPGTPYSVDLALIGPACPRDTREPNDALAAPAMIGTGLITGLHACTDEDWYAIDVNAGDEISVELDFVPLEGDVDLSLSDASGTVLASSTSVFSTERVRHTVNATATYYIRVWLGLDLGSIEGNPYDMTVTVTTPPMCADDTYEDNDAAGSPSMIGPMSIGGLALCPGDDDWYAFAVRTGDVVNLDVLFSDGEGDVDADLYDGAGTIVDQGRSASDNEALTHEVTTSGTYAVRVYLYGDDGSVPGNTYSVDLNIIGCTYDSFEPNDSAAASAPVLAGQHGGLGICSTDNDYYAIDLDAGDRVTVDIMFSDADGDVDLELRDAGGGLLDQSDSVTDNEQVAYDVTTTGTYTIRVLLYMDAGSNPGNAYSMSITR